ncbi:sce7725 family protein [Clostridium tertium]|uniref:sce7725 family protein n=1 Tax=Clostridium tertium TaxID=1559 RepID=UPI0018AAFF78|nr:sce7725 family protein [Clostridium tertium]
MYLPYLRARQFELIALRELVEKDLIGDRILPIIEPIKLSSTLIKTIEAFINKDKKIVIIHNPKVGDFLEEIKDERKKEKFKRILENRNVIIGHIINNNSKEELEKLTQDGLEEVLIINNNINYLNIYSEVVLEIQPLYTLIPDEGLFRRKSKGNKILLADRFNKKDRNSDYSDTEDEVFTEDHLYYMDEGYAGFSDYSIIGSNFSESGFAPYAVALHIIYFDEDKVLRIKHFVSDSNEDIRNPAGKFYEAISKLNEWQYNEQSDSYALQELREYYRSEGYPGLGTAKKLSLMHHLEILSRYLDGVNNYDLL